MLTATACDGVMSSGRPRTPPSSPGPDLPAAQSRSRAVLTLSRLHPPRVCSVLKAHFFKFLYMALDEHRDLRTELGTVLGAEEVYRVVEAACQREEAKAEADPDTMHARCDEEGAPYLTWYRRHRGATAAPADRYGGFVPTTEEAEPKPPCCEA